MNEFFNNICIQILSILAVFYFIYSFAKKAIEIALDIFAFKKATSKVYSWFAFKLGTKKTKRKAIKYDIETYLNEEIKLSNKRAFNSDILITENVIIKWVKVEEDEGIYDEDDWIVIRLGYNMDENRNYIEAIMRFLDKYFIPNTKPYLDDKLRTALKLVFIHQTVLDRGDKAFRYYNSHYLSTQLNDPQILFLRDKISLIKKKGFFTPVLLRELNELSIRLSKNMISRTGELDREIEDFIEFLYNIADKENYRSQVGSDPPLNFIRNYIKTNIILVMRSDTQSIQGHVNAVGSWLKKGATSIYIAGSGKNKDFVKSVFLKGLVANENKYNLEHHVCVDMEIEYDDRTKKDRTKKEGKICLITRS